MATWSAARTRLSAASLARFGEPATYTPAGGAAIATQAVTLHDTASLGEQGIQVTTAHCLLDLPSVDIAAVKKADSVVVTPAGGSAINYRVERLLKRDESFVRILVIAS